MGRERVGEFEQLVLLAAMHLGPKAYTVSIMQEIERRTGRTLTHASVYVALRRLEARGLVASSLGDPSPERGGRAKRFFSVDARVLPLLKEARAALESMWDGLEAT